MLRIFVRLAVFILAFALLPGIVIYAESPKPIIIDQHKAVKGHVHLALTADDLPVVAYYGGEMFNMSLFVAFCSDPSCSKWTVQKVTLPERALIYDIYDFALNSKGIPVFAVYDYGKDRELLITCADAQCSGKATIAVLDQVKGEPLILRIALTSNDAPLVLYGGKGLTFYACDGADCAKPTKSPLVDETQTLLDFNLFFSLNADNVLTLSYKNDKDRSSSAVHMIACNDTACTKSNAVTLNKEIGGTNAYAVTFTEKGLPLIIRKGFGESHIITCNDLACSVPKDTTITADVVSFTGTSLVLSSKGTPAWAMNFEMLTIVTCAEADCSTTPHIAKLFKTDPVLDLPTALKLTKKDLPVMAYRDEKSDAVTLVVCSTATCE